MPTSKYFAQCPPFPSDIPVANIPILSFQKLRDNDSAEAEKLYEACQEHGFFLLDVIGSNEGERLLHNAETMFALTEEVLNLEKATLDQFAYDAPRSLLGYKSSGKLRTDDGKFDAIEMYSLGQDDILGVVPPRKNPDPIEMNRKSGQMFFRDAFLVIAVVLSNLDSKLGLPPGTLEALSPLDKTSDTSLRLLLSHPQSANGTVDPNRIVLGGHTDIGTITLLFHVAGGLQILPAGSENINANWRYIRPEPGCALINIGDTLVEWTGGLLRSSLHRVVTAPGPQAYIPRLSLAYLIRPERNATMRRLRSSVIPGIPEDEEEETRSVSDWAAWRARQIMNGELKPQTKGGKR